MVDLIYRWTLQNRFDRSYLPDIQDKLFFHGDMALRKATNYTVLLLLATVIAAYGVISASTATVIGAMLVAPLMTPIMGATLALVTGEQRQAVRSLAIVAVSVTAVILLAMLLATPMAFIDFEGNGEITSRVQPDLVALAVALAAGAAGSFATSRREIGDSLPGVAISISLVPPLCVTGIALGSGRIEEALGSLLLFTTNFLAILLAGGFVFWLSGASDLKLNQEQISQRTSAYVITAMVTLIVASLLAATSVQAYRNHRDTALAQTAVETWLLGSDYEALGVVVRSPLRHRHRRRQRRPRHRRIPRPAARRRRPARPASPARKDRPRARNLPRSREAIAVGHHAALPPVEQRGTLFPPVGIAPALPPVEQRGTLFALVGIAPCPPPCRASR